MGTSSDPSSKGNYGSFSLPGSHTIFDLHELAENHVLEITSDVCELSVLRYLPNEIDNATHVDELPIPYQTVVRINAMQMGIAGDNTWGAKTHDEYLLPKNEELHFRFKIKGY